VGTPAASDLPLAPGAGHGGEGDASLQGPAQEEVLPASPKSTNKPTNKPTQELPINLETATNTDDASSTVIALAARFMKPEGDETNAREAGGLVTVRAKPEKRLNAKDRAKARREKNKPEAAEEAVVTPEAASSETTSLSTAHPKPEKRKNAKERAKEKFAKKDAKEETEDGTRPMTATAKSKVESKADTKKAKKTKQSKAAA
jgi:hypothetical protein